MVVVMRIDLIVIEEVLMVVASVVAAEIVVIELLVVDVVVVVGLGVGRGVVVERAAPADVRRPLLLLLLL